MIQFTALHSYYQYSHHTKSYSPCINMVCFLPIENVAREKRMKHILKAVYTLMDQKDGRKITKMMTALLLVSLGHGVINCKQSVNLIYYWYLFVCA